MLAILDEKGILQRMSRKDYCFDNAIVEEFFGIMKSVTNLSKKMSSIQISNPSL